MFSGLPKTFPKSPRRSLRTPGAASEKRAKPSQASNALGPLDAIDESGFDSVPLAPGPEVEVLQLGMNAVTFLLRLCV